MSPQQLSGDRSTVALVKVTDKHTGQKSVDYAVREAIDLLGGMDRFVKEGQIVAIKPNQTLFKLATDGSTTAPQLIISLVKLCRQAGAKDVWITEAAGHAQTTRKIMQITGMASAAKEAGARIIYLEEVGQKVVDFGEDAPVRYMPVPEVLEQVDVFINCPKAKTHFVDPISGACKNWVGVMPMSTRLWAQKKVDAYYQGTAELLKRYRPNLTKFDGMVAGEGQGPGSNSPFWWGYLLASDDPVAADVTLARLFSLEWSEVRMAREAGNMGVGMFDPGLIDLVGAAFDTAVRKVQAADPSVHRYPCRVIVGDGPASAIEGTLGHWKTLADTWLDAGVWELLTSKGTPTFMFGNADDPLFEDHVRSGPYVVLDDSAKDRYKFDPRVTFVPGSPVPQSYMQHEMIEGMGFGQLYEPGLRLFESAKKYKGEITGMAGKRAQKGAMIKGIAAAAVVAAAVRTIGYVRSCAETNRLVETSTIVET